MIEFNNSVSVHQEIFDYHQLNCIKLSITYETKSYQLRIPFTKRL